MGISFYYYPTPAKYDKLYPTRIRVESDRHNPIYWLYLLKQETSYSLVIMHKSKWTNPPRPNPARIVIHIHSFDSLSYLNDKKLIPIHLKDISINMATSQIQFFRHKYLKFLKPKLGIRLDKARSSNKPNQFIQFNGYIFYDHLQGRLNLINV